MRKGHPHRVLYPNKSGGVSPIGNARRPVTTATGGVVGPEVSHLGWGHWYTLRELEASTNGFGSENVIYQGGYGIIYHGVLENKSQVAVKNLLNNRGQVEKEFEVEVEAIGKVRHKNLLRLLGYCAEGVHAAEFPFFLYADSFLNLTTTDKAQFYVRRDMFFGDQPRNKYVLSTYKLLCWL
ncbi:hypothetical protein L6452_30885 [Arctium lappa]|uniref:Uncharacterized protein n=1 Tax=Arctium lappa TaxID=4217 RepID=A0ACB8ZKK3_ARCLA|nr:hypothetical protein L6452_30885 [Arctium lappa]